MYNYHSLKGAVLMASARLESNGLTGFANQPGKGQDMPRIVSFRFEGKTPGEKAVGLMILRPDLPLNTLEKLAGKPPQPATVICDATDRCPWVPDCLHTGLP